MMIHAYRWLRLETSGVQGVYWLGCEGQFHEFAVSPPWLGCPYACMHGIDAANVHESPKKRSMQRGHALLTDLFSAPFQMYYQLQELSVKAAAYPLMQAGVHG